MRSFPTWKLLSYSVKSLYQIYLQMWTRSCYPIPLENVNVPFIEPLKKDSFPSSEFELTLWLLKRNISNLYIQKQIGTCDSSVEFFWSLFSVMHWMCKSSLRCTGQIMQRDNWGSCSRLMRTIHWLNLQMHGWI